MLPHPQNLTGGSQTSKLLLAANKRLNTNLLAESFAQLWDFNREA